MKLYYFFCFALLLISCKQQNTKLAETPIDAARYFKTACLQGNFSEAKNYVTTESKNNNKLVDIENIFNKLNNAQQQKSFAASLVIYAIKQTSSTTATIILKDTYTNINDTLQAVQQQQNWLIKL